MNIVEVVKKILSECPLVTEFTHDIHVDFASNKTGDFGLYSLGDEVVREDIIGNQTRRHRFALYACNQSINDYDRLVNSSFLLNLSYWLEGVKGQKLNVTIDGVNKTGEVTEMSAANGMVFDVPTGDVNDGVTYQLQIYATYTLESEGI